ncbi:MAG: CAF17-like 4Fe-4S cluster assembly/insertion protein YgfZ [Thermoanaerobaculaceae bacterium]
MFLLTPSGRGEELLEKLNFYLRFSHCLANFCSAMGFLLIGNGAQAASSLGLQEPLAPGTCGQWPQGLLFAETLLGLPGLFAVGLSEPTGIPQISPEEVTLSRIKGGFFAWGLELVDDVLPQEVGWGEPLVSLGKGCYIGQETAARLATYGHTTRTLVRLRAEGVSSMLESLPELLYLPGDGKAVGRITSFARDRATLWALALIRRKEAEVGAVFNGADCRWEVTDVLA